MCVYKGTVGPWWRFVLSDLYFLLKCVLNVQRNTHILKLLLHWRSQHLPTSIPRSRVVWTNPCCVYFAGTWEQWPSLSVEFPIHILCNNSCMCAERSRKWPRPVVITGRAMHSLTCPSAVPRPLACSPPAGVFTVYHCHAEGWIPPSLGKRLYEMTWFCSEPMNMI